MANEANPCPCNIGDTFDYRSLGCEISVEHISAYLCKPSLSAEKAVIVIHDIYGWQLPNTRCIVDMLAANGYLAILPDFYKGQEPWKPSNDWSTFNEWLKTRDAKKINTEADVVLKYLKEQRNVKKIGVIGFCWGGAAVHHLMSSYSEFKAGVSLYGVIRLAEDKYNLLNPTFFIFGEKDEIIPLEQVAELEQKLTEHCKVDFEVKIYLGQTHGFVHRKREDINPKDKPYIEEAKMDMMNWLNRYIL
ncbi:carboxymethylenebutenolidase homolog isoform X1 [Sphaerodactylus townsendi]|uniref:carboxymethylenebutenolidase homolog isoform X1 n=1 Tax=Sphaerodactylus townsendi TaxID=933632 RepID=UPI002025DC73|nr:carboxymethylenebutenolidase homolog isoform X1 [Sphaerodactylus townsendi]XP_048371141.1 carboxymethylenebutenolidase homolog isoform X1 [Sphaerodactylus townsendi]